MGGCPSLAGGPQCSVGPVDLGASWDREGYIDGNGSAIQHKTVLGSGRGGLKSTLPSAAALESGTRNLCSSVLSSLKGDGDCYFISSVNSWALPCASPLVSTAVSL